MIAQWVVGRTEVLQIDRFIFNGVGYPVDAVCIGEGPEIDDFMN